MLPNLKDFAHPETIEKAVEVLSRQSPRARPIAGGTAVTLSRDDKTETLVDLTRLGLDHIRTTKQDILIECCVTASQLATCDDCDPSWMAIQDAAAGAGPAGVRNAQTVGGSLAQCFPWADLPVALLAVGSTVEIAGPTPRTVNIENMLDKHPSKQLGPGEFIQAIRIPRVTDSASAFLKDADTVGDYALASSAVWIRLDAEKQKIDDIRLVLGAVRPLPIRVYHIDSLLHKKPDDEWMRMLTDLVRESVEPLEDMRAGSTHRKRVVAALARRAARLALERAGVRTAETKPAR